MKERDELVDVRIADLVTFLAVRRHGSVSAAARELEVTPSQVSKAMDRLSAALGKRLIGRTGRGVALTEEGERLAPLMQDVVSRLHQMRGETDPIPELTIAAPSYLITDFLAPIAVALPGFRVRGVQLAPALIRAYATERLFNVVLLLGEMRLPAVWVSRSIGRLRKALFASPRLANRLRPFPVSPDRIRDVPFVSPLLFANGQMLPADDDCPLSRAERRVGHEAQMISLAMTVAAASDQLVFGPVIASKSFRERKALVEVPVIGWNVFDELHVACHGEDVRAHTQTAIVHALSDLLAHLE